MSAAIFKVSFLIADDILSAISGNESIQSIQRSITFMYNYNVFCTKKFRRKIKRIKLHASSQPDVPCLPLI